MNKGNEVNESNEGKYVWLRVKLGKEEHRRLKVLAAERGGTLAGLVVELLGVGGTLTVKGSVPKPEVPGVVRAPEGRKGYTSAYTKG